MKLIPIFSEIFNNNAVTSDVAINVCNSILAMYPDTGPISPWLGYLTEVEGKLIGSCAFKSVPSDDRVEIAYFTFPGFEEKGYATAMARELISIAQSYGLATVFAQTLQEFNASTTILSKLGFHQTGIAMDDEAGEVWEWTLDLK